MLATETKHSCVEGFLLKVTKEWLQTAEDQYPGIQKTIESWEAQELPPCPRCGSVDSAKVSVGLVGRSITVAAATTKICLLSNGPTQGDLYCNACRHYFDVGKTGEP